MSKCELQIKMQEALGLVDDDFGVHETDLYVVARPGVGQWLRENWPFPKNIKTFVGNAAATDWNGAGKLCYDIPFAAWEVKHPPKAQTA